MHDEPPAAEAIKDWAGSREHRGRKFPVAGCLCAACRVASITGVLGHAA
jgi:hypothetical protein